MAEQDKDDKTEEATAKTLSQARERGQMPRSQDFSGAITVLILAALVGMLGPQILDDTRHLMVAGMTFDKEMIDRVNDLPEHLGLALFNAFWVIRWLLLTAVLVALLAPFVNGGFNFSSQAFSPNFGKLNPLNGIVRMFGGQSLVNLVRNLLKFFVIGTLLVSLLWSHHRELIAIAQSDLEPMLRDGAHLAIQIFLTVSLGVAILAILDVPYQRWTYLKGLRMTKQEVKDEMKDMMGRPEIRQAIRRRQREISKRRMMSKIKDADVVVVNPTEFAVALEYDELTSTVPIVLAKGRADVAAAIKEQAAKAAVPIIETPVLARALYYTTELDSPIPEPLYRAVASVLAYVFKANDWREARNQMVFDEADVPEEFRFDEYGNTLSRS
jgi:flagellar biosynthesis protein FlhB